MGRARFGTAATLATRLILLAYSVAAYSGKLATMATLLNI
jgi:hypothetical protein